MPRLSKIFAVKAALSQIGQGIGDLWRAATNYVAPPDVIRARELKALARDEAQAGILSKRIQSRRAALGEKVSFGHVDPETLKPEILEQLVKNERVHPAGEEELLARRLGGVHATKRCFARMVKVGKQTDVSSAIYTARVNVPLKDGRLPYEDLPGIIDRVKEMDIEDYQPPKDGEVCVAVLYTISGAKTYDWVKGGRELADQVYKHLKEEADRLDYPLYITTLSPARDFSKWLHKNPETRHLTQLANVENYPEFQDTPEHKEIISSLYEATPELLEKIKTPEGRAEMRKLFLRYALEAKDPVMNFHLGNGAIFADLNFNFENALDWLMPNYFYAFNVQMVAENKAIYQTGVRPMTLHLYNELRATDMNGLLPHAMCVSDAESVAPALPKRSAQLDFDLNPHT